MKPIDRLEHMIDEYLESLACFGTKDTGYYYVGDSLTIENLLYEFGYDIEDLKEKLIQDARDEELDYE